MAGRIPQQFIDDLMARVDIVEVIDARVPLKKAGRDYKACCPFHGEKTPSFTVSATKQFYHCFGCGAHGTALGFLMDYEHLDFVEAVEELARGAGLTVPREAAPAGTPRERTGADLYGLLENAAVWFQRALRTPAAKGAVAYLKGRGLSGEIAAEFGIGYAPAGWDNLLRTLGTDAAARHGLVEAGLAIPRDEGGAYDRFRDRVMFPIRDRRGRVIGFGGRVLRAEDTPKYLNSPETPVFHKGRELYGLFEARKAVRHLERLLVVEGYMDVVALAQHGIRYAVATLGTATTHDHLEQLFRVVPEVVFCFDGDRAGRSAAWRAVENALPVLRDGREARFLLLPEGEDPDTLVRKEGKEGFEQRIANAIPFSEFFFEELTRQVDTSSMDGRARLAELARPLVSNLPEGVFHELMVQRLAELTGLPSARLAARMGGVAAPPPFRPPPRREEGRGSLVRQAIALLLQEPTLAGAVEHPERLAGTDLPGLGLLAAVLEFLRANPHLNAAAILEHWRGTDEGRYLRKLAQWTPPVPEAGLAAEFGGAIRRLYGQALDRRTELLLDKAGREELPPAERQELQELLATRRAPER